MTKPDVDISPEAIVRAAYDLRAHGVYRTDMDIADMLEAIAADRDRLAKERDEAKAIIRDTLWMAQRYASGRRSTRFGEARQSHGENRMSIVEKSKADQVADQCKVVAYLAGIIAGMHSDFEEIVRSGKSANLIEIWGARTADLMEQLGNILNATDSATEDDAWADEIFERAQKLWPNSR